MSSTEADKKVQDYKKRIREIEEENEHITAQLAKARHHIKRLRIERIVLLDEIDDLQKGGARSTGNAAGSNAGQSKRFNGALGGTGAGNDSDSEMSVSESVMSETKGPAARKGRVIGGGAVGTPGGTSTSTAQRKKRDPNAPKGPGNVFFLYCRMERDSIKDEVPNESLGEVTRLLGQKWKALTKEEKQKYYDLYRKEMDEYETAMKSYTAAGGGAEGAAAVAAAAAAQQEEEEKLKQDKINSDKTNDHDDIEDDEEEEEDEDEIDMLQDEDEDDNTEEEMEEELVEEDEEMGSASNNAISTMSQPDDNATAVPPSTKLSSAPQTTSSATYTSTTSEQQ